MKNIIKIGNYLKSVNSDHVKSAVISSIVAFVFTPLVVLVTVYGSNYLNESDIQIQYVKTYIEEDCYVLEDKVTEVFIRNKDISNEIMQMAMPLVVDLQQSKDTDFFKSNLNNFLQMWSSAANGTILEIVPRIGELLVPIFDKQINKVKKEISLIIENIEKIKHLENRMTASYNNTKRLDLDNQNYFYLLENDPEKLIRMHKFIVSQTEYYVNDLISIRNALFDISKKPIKKSDNLYFEIGLINKGNTPATMTNDATLFFDSNDFQLNSDDLDYESVDPRAFLAKTYRVNLANNINLKERLLATKNTSIKCLIKIFDAEKKTYKFKEYLKINI